MEIKINEKQIILLKYLSEIENNISIPYWQRILNVSRVDELYQNLKKELHNNQNPTINLGLIVVTEYKDSEWNLIDGQHRYMAMKKLQDEDGIDVQILINLIKISELDEMDELFRKINQSTPVLLPPRTTKYNKFKTVAQEIANIFPRAFSSSDNPKRPHLNVQKVSEHLGLNYKFPDHSEHLLIEKIKQTKDYGKWITYIEDRPFNDKRYYISNQKVKDLGWTIEKEFDTGLDEVIEKMRPTCSV